MTPRIFVLGATLAIVASPAWTETAESGVLYRCPGNEYNNTISASEAEKLHCKRVEGNVTVVRSPGGAASGGEPVPAAAVDTTKMPAENTALRARASDNRRQLESRLRSEERNLTSLEKAFNGGEPERRKDESNFQNYLDRIASMRSEIARKQIEIAELRRELDKLPSAR